MHRRRYGTHRYTRTARWLHWIIAAAVLVIVVLGLWIVYFEPQDEAFKLQLYDLHQSLGITVLLLVLWRIALRLTRAPLPVPRDTPAPVQLAAGLNHFLLYVLLLAQPVLGSLATNARGFQVDWWGVLPIPAPVGKDEDLARLLSALHWYGGMLLVALVAVHLGIVAYHTLGRRDGLLRRML
jgi:cytochrome b561